MSDIGNIGGFLNNSLSQISQKSDAFHNRVNEMTAKKDGITSEDMLQLQFEMGQYNALIESISNITKSLTETLKSLAQRAG
jgi:type III secretion protein F